MCYQCQLKSQNGSYKLISADSMATDSYYLFCHSDRMQQPNPVHMAGKRLNWVPGSSFFCPFPRFSKESTVIVKDKLKIDVVIVLEIEIDANQSVG